MQKAPETIFRAAIPETGEWWCLHTKPQQEFRIERELAFRGIATYLPAIIRKGMLWGRELVRSLPLFPGYIFLRGSDNDLYVARCAKRVCGVLKVADQARLTAELEMIAKAINSGVPLSVCKIQQGDVVKITTGPLMGVSGIVVSGDSESVLLNCTMLNSAVSIRLCDVELSPRQ